MLVDAMGLVFGRQGCRTWEHGEPGCWLRLASKRYGRGAAVELSGCVYKLADTTEQFWVCLQR